MAGASPGLPTAPMAPSQRGAAHKLQLTVEDALRVPYAAIALVIQNSRVSAKSCGIAQYTRQRDVQTQESSY